jgi:hypothetical protein
VGGRVHSLLTEAWHFVLLVAGVGVAVAGLAALIGFAGGKRGGHLVVTVMIALVVTGLVSIVVAMVLDPMGAGSFSLGFGGTRKAAVQAGILHDEESGMPPRVKSEFRRDDVFYGSGVLLILLAVLVGYVCSWFGVPPTNPFG